MFELYKFKEFKKTSNDRLQLKINKLRYDKEILKKELKKAKDAYLIADKRLRMCQHASDYKKFNDTINLHLTVNNNECTHNIPLYIKNKMFNGDLEIIVDKFPRFTKD